MSILVYYASVIKPLRGPLRGLSSRSPGNAVLPFRVKGVFCE